MSKTLQVGIILLCFWVSIFTANAQGNQVTLDPLQITASALPLMVHAEAKVGAKNSFTFGGGLAYSGYLEVVNGEESFEFYSAPFLTSSFRNYYKRRRVNKNNLQNNSGNYVGLLSYYTFKSIVSIDSDNVFETDENSFSIGPVWGFQRNYASGIHLDFSIGLGYMWVENLGDILDDVNGVTIVSGFELGYRFNLN